MGKCLQFFFISLSAATVFLAGPCLAARSEEVSIERVRLLESINTWADLARKASVEGQAAAEIVINLENGVKASTSSATHSVTADVFTLNVVHSKVNQGEIATPSKVPVIWTLEQDTKYTLFNNQGTWTLAVEGIKLLPFSEGSEMYQASQVATRCTSEADIRARVACERVALFDWYAAQYKSGVFTTKDYLKNPSHKLGRILKGMYGSSVTYYAVKSKGADGWSKILYSLVTIPPVQVDSFTFAQKSKNYKEVEMGMKTTPVYQGSYDGLDLSNYAGLDFPLKNRAEFDKADFQSQRSKAEYFARSGINFGAMTAKGKDPTVQGGTAEYIINFVTPCYKGDKDKYNDPTVECKSSYGRVSWH